MNQVNSWAALFNQAVANTHINAMPKKAKAEDWFMLRDRWNSYPESQRRFYLAAALGRYVLNQQEKGEAVDPDVIAAFSFGASRRLEDFADSEKKAIAMAIIDAERYSKLDNALISRQRAFKSRLYQAD